MVIRINTLYEYFQDNSHAVIQYIKSEDNIADILTKPLTGALFIKLRNLIRGYNL